MRRIPIFEWSTLGDVEIARAVMEYISRALPDP